GSRSRARTSSRARSLSSGRARSAAIRTCGPRWKRWRPTTSRSSTARSSRTWASSSRMRSGRSAWRSPDRPSRAPAPTGPRAPLENLPHRLAAALLRLTIFPFGAHAKPPSDALGALVAQALLDDREERLRLTRDIYVPAPDDPGLGRLEAALDKAVAAAPAFQ